MNNSNNKWLTENPLFKNKDQRYYYDFGTGIKVERDEVEKEREAFLNAAGGSSNKPKKQEKDEFLEGFDDPYGEKREQERKERLAKIRENADKRNWSSQSATDPFLDGFNFGGIVKKREKEDVGFQKKEPKLTPLPLAPVGEIKLQKLPGDPNKPLTLVQYANKETNDPWGPALGGDLNSNKDKELFLKGFVGTSKEDGILKNAIGTGKTSEIKLMSNPISTGKELLNKASVWANEKGIFDDVTNAFFKVSDLSQDYPFKTLPTNLTHQILANVNHKENQKIDLGVYEADGGYINDQNVRGSQSGKIRYGTGTFNQNGCGIIAVNNALVSLGDRRDIRDIAKDFEKDGQVLFGAFGTSPHAIDDYFKKQGYQVETFTGDKKIYNLNIPEADTYIISFWNSDKATNMIHTVSVDKLDNGKYRIYNENGRRVLDVNSLNEYLIKNNRVPLVLHCIKKG